MDGMETLRAFYDGKTPFILCFWHGNYIPVLPLFEGFKATVLTSRSDRGDILAQICTCFGYDSIQIPDHGGKASLKLMERLCGAPAAAIAVDGPLGPYHVVKRGVIRLASAMGFSLLPVSLEARWKIILWRRWDRLEIPLPFSRVLLKIKAPLQPPAGGITLGETESWAIRLAEVMEDPGMGKNPISGGPS